MTFDPTISWNVLIYIGTMLVAGAFAYARIQALVSALTLAVKGNAEVIERLRDRLDAVENANAAYRATLEAVQRDIALIRGAQDQTNALLVSLLKGESK